MADTEVMQHKKYFNREINWIDFNGRVLEEALDERNPLLERAKFLAIYHSNLDEFFMVRVSGLDEQAESGITEPSEDGLTPLEQVLIIRTKLMDYNNTAMQFMEQKLLPALASKGIHVFHYAELDAEQKKHFTQYYEREVFPVLTPLAVDPGHPFPHISNLSLSLAVAIRSADGKEQFARVKIPGLLPRLVPVEMHPDAQGNPQQGFVWLEDIIAANLQSLFPGMEIVKTYPFRVIRDADLEIREDEAGDLLQTIAESLDRRRFGQVIHLTVSEDMPETIVKLLQTNLDLQDWGVYRQNGPMGLSALFQLGGIDRPELKDPPYRGRIPKPLRDSSSIFDVIRKKDIIFHHPYDSFTPVVEFIQEAARDREVLAIKQTIYRVGSNSPIIEALARAAMNGKQVSVLVELKARFDEENNIEWARALEKSGAHVVYGRVELKTHCKVALVVRKEADGIRRYVHLGTGNYNAKTANIYTDLGILTARPDIGADASTLFNSLTGYAVSSHYNKLLVAPNGIRQGVMQRIEREMQHAREGRGGHLVIKVNALVDFRMVDALYEASQAGVKIDLLIRGSSCLVPGVPGMSENIRLISVVGRFLEHSRIYYFRNGGNGNEEVYLGSADLMQRNLDRRVETLFPIEDDAMKRFIIEHILPAYLKDNTQSRLLLPDGTYRRLAPTDGQKPFNVQDFFLHSTTEVSDFELEQAK